MWMWTVAKGNWDRKTFTYHNDYIQLSHPVLADQDLHTTLSPFLKEWIQWV